MRSATAEIASRSTVVLIRGCGPLGHALAEGLERRGHRTVSLDVRTAASGADARCVDLRDASALRWEFASIGRDSAPVAAVVVLPRYHGPTGPTWEQAVAEELLETTAVVRASARVLQRDGGRLVLIPATSVSQRQGRERSTPADALIELGATAVATESDLAVTRCVLPMGPPGDVATEQVTRCVLTAISGPTRAASTVDVAMARPRSPQRERGGDDGQVRHERSSAPDGEVPTDPRDLTRVESVDAAGGPVGLTQPDAVGGRSDGRALPRRQRRTIR